MADPEHIGFVSELTNEDVPLRSFPSRGNVATSSVLPEIEVVKRVQGAQQVRVFCTPYRTGGAAIA